MYNQQTPREKKSEGVVLTPSVTGGNHDYTNTLAPFKHPLYDDHGRSRRFDPFQTYHLIIVHLPEGAQDMMNGKKGIILVGHGGIPKDYPGELVTKLKRLEAQRRAAGQPMSAEELELDTKIRTWPRTPATDPYKAGLEALASHMKPMVNGALFAVAYNEFCGPTLHQAVEDLIRQGAQSITVVSTMFTPGGSHSEYEIPEELAELREKHPGITLTYAWPYNLTQVSSMLMDHINKFA